MSLQLVQIWVTWFKIHAQYTTLRIIAKPHAKRMVFVKITEQELHLAMHAKPHQGTTA
jgi:uncharacterized protein